MAKSGRGHLRGRLPKLDDRDLPPSLRWLDADEAPRKQPELLREAALRLGLSQDSIRWILRPRATAGRITELMRLYDRAGACLPNPQLWFQTKNPSLNDKAPIEALATDNGAEMVANLLTQIEFGTAT